MKIHSHTIAVRIDKQKQEERRTWIGKLMMDPRYIFMRFNLQYGEIIQKGSALEMPEIEVGDIALFHHVVEEDSYNLVETKDNGDEIRLVRPIPHHLDDGLSSQLYGVIKPNGKIIPFDTLVFLKNELTPLEPTIEAENLMLTGEDGDSAERIAERQDEATRHRKSLETTIGHLPNLSKREEVLTEINKIYLQQDSMAMINNRMTRSLATIAHASPKCMAEGLNTGDQIMIEKELLYGINIMGLSFFILRSRFIDGVLSKS